MLKDNCLSESINGTTHSVKVVNPQQFRIGSTLEYSKYESLGFAKQIRVPKKLTFKTLEETFKKNENIPYDQNMLIADFEKMSNA
jgi:ubiquitin-activating enzyme E1